MQAQATRELPGPADALCDARATSSNPTADSRRTAEKSTRGSEALGFEAKGAAGIALTAARASESMSKDAVASSGGGMAGLYLLMKVQP